eukprot:543678-Pyramimonas_sp.AAC.1
MGNDFARELSRPEPLRARDDTVRGLGPPCPFWASGPRSCPGRLPGSSHASRALFRSCLAHVLSRVSSSWR